MSGKIVVWLLAIVLISNAQDSVGDGPGEADEASAPGTTMAEEESYPEGPMLVANAAFGPDESIQGKITFSYSFMEYGAQTVLWSSIYKEGAPDGATVSVKLVPYWYFVGEATCTSLNDEEFEHYDIIVDMPLPNTPVAEPTMVEMVMQANLTGGMTVWDKYIVAVDSVGDVSCSWPKLKETEDVEEMIWTYACLNSDPTWEDFAYAANKAQLPLSKLQPVPVEPKQWFYEDDEGCCHSMILTLGKPTKAEIEKIYYAATEPGIFGKFAMTQTCKTNLEDSFLREDIKYFKNKFMPEKKDDGAVKCSKTSDSTAWYKAFSEWQQEFARYKARSGYQAGDSSYSGQYGYDKPQKELNALDQLLLGLGFTSQEEMMERKQQSISSLQTSIDRLRDGDDIRHVAADIITTLFTQNEWIRKPAEVRSVVKEIMCRIASSSGHQEAIAMIAELLKEMREDSEVTLETVLDRMIRKSILESTKEYRFGQLVEMVFGDGEDMVPLLRKRFMEGLGLDGAKDAFTHFSVEAMRDYIKSQGNALNATIQRYVAYNSGRLSNDTKHILKAVSKLTGEFVDGVMDNLVAIIKYPNMVTEVNANIKHAIDDLIDYDENGKFTEDLKYMLGPNPRMPIEGLPLRLMIFVIQPRREECNLDELVNYIPEQPKAEEKYWEPRPQGGSVDPYYWEDMKQYNPPQYQQQGRQQQQFANQYGGQFRPVQQYGYRRDGGYNAAYDRGYGQGQKYWPSRQQGGQQYGNGPQSDYMNPGDNGGYYGGYNNPRGGQWEGQGGRRYQEQNGGRWGGW